MWWAALIPVAMELLGQMSKQNKGGEGAPPMQFQPPAPFNPSPMMTGDGPDPAMTARALGGQLPGILSQPPDFGDSDRLADILRRGDTSIFR